MAQNEQIKTDNLTGPSNHESISEAVMDLKEAGLSPEEAYSASQTITAKNNKKMLKKERDNMASIPKVRWFLLLILSLLTIIAWAVEAQYSARPYKWPALGILVFSILLATFGAKLLRLPTRGGLLAFLASITFIISALYGPSELLFNHIPAALVWSFYLLAIVIWAMVAVWRRLSQVPVLMLLLYILLLVAASAPAWAIFTQMMAALPPTLDFNILSNSPKLLTDLVPWFVWPMSIMLAVVLPLSAIFALTDQVTALSQAGTRHGGDLFLALAFLALLPYGFLSYDKAMENFPAGVHALRGLYHPALAYARPVVPTAEGDYQYAHTSESKATSQASSPPLTDADRLIQSEFPETAELLFPDQIEKKNPSELPQGSTTTNSMIQEQMPETTDMLFPDHVETTTKTSTTTEAQTASPVPPQSNSAAEILIRNQMPETADSLFPSEESTPQVAPPVPVITPAGDATTELTSSAPSEATSAPVIVQEQAETPPKATEESAPQTNDKAPNASPDANQPSTPELTAATEDSASLADRLLKTEASLNATEKRLLELEAQVKLLLQEKSQTPAPTKP